MKTIALSCLLLVSASFARAQSEPRSVPIVEPAQAELQRMLDGGMHCRKDDVRALVAAFDSLPGLGSAAEARGEASRRSSAWCERKAAVLYFKIRGLIPYAIRQADAAIWLERENGVAAVKNSELSDYLEGVAAAYHAAGRADPRLSSKPMTRSFTLSTDLPSSWLSGWRTNAADPFTLIVNQGDTVALRLVHTLYNTMDYANFTLEGYGVSWDVSLTDARGAAVAPFVADRPGTFSFYDVRSLNRIKGRLIVLPR